MWFESSLQCFNSQLSTTCRAVATKADQLSTSCHSAVLCPPDSYFRSSVFDQLVARPIRSIQRFSFSAFSLILFVTDLFHPFNNFTVKRFLNGDMSHPVVGVAPCQCFSPGGKQ